MYLFLLQTFKYKVNAKVLFNTGINLKSIYLLFTFCNVLTNFVHTLLVNHVNHKLVEESIFIENWVPLWQSAIFGSYIEQSFRKMGTANMGNKGIFTQNIANGIILAPLHTPPTPPPPPPPLPPLLTPIQIWSFYNSDIEWALIFAMSCQNLASNKSTKQCNTICICVVAMITLLDGWPCFLQSYFPLQPFSPQLLSSSAPHLLHKSVSTSIDQSW